VMAAGLCCGVLLLLRASAFSFFADSGLLPLARFGSFAGLYAPHTATTTATFIAPPCVLRTFCYVLPRTANTPLPHQLRFVCRGPAAGFFYLFACLAPCAARLPAARAARVYARCERRDTQRRCAAAGWRTAYHTPLPYCAVAAQRAGSRTACLPGERTALYLLLLVPAFR
jgi:hypothetical protein